MMNEEMTSAGGLAASSPSDGRAKAINPNGNAMGHPYFDCDSKTFMQARHSRLKGQRWSDQIGKSEWADSIRMYARKNKNPDFLLRNTDDGTFLFAQSGIIPKSKS
ncbi:MAG: hypothetical protein R8M45_04355 [Ghiorsea sp.]